MFANLMIAVLSSLSAGHPAQENEPSESGRAVVHGTLTDFDGSPMSGVEIRLQPSAGPFLGVSSTRMGPTGVVEAVPRDELERQAEAAYRDWLDAFRSTTTDDEGRYRFESLAPSLRAAPQPIGLAGWVSETLVTSEDGTDQLRDLHRHRTHPVEVKMQVPQGVPVPALAIQLTHYDAQNTWTRFVQRPPLEWTPSSPVLELPEGACSLRVWRSDEDTMGRRATNVAVQVSAGLDEPLLVDVRVDQTIRFSIDGQGETSATQLPVMVTVASVLVGDEARDQDIARSRHLAPSPPTSEQQVARPGRYTVALLAWDLFDRIPRIVEKRTVEVAAGQVVEVDFRAPRFERLDLEAQVVLAEGLDPGATSFSVRGTNLPGLSDRAGRAPTEPGPDGAVRVIYGWRLLDEVPSLGASRELPIVLELAHPAVSPLSIPIEPGNEGRLVLIPDALGSVRVELPQIDTETLEYDARLWPSRVTSRDQHAARQDLTVSNRTEPTVFTELSTGTWTLTYSIRGADGRVLARTSVPVGVHDDGELLVRLEVPALHEQRFRLPTLGAGRQSLLRHGASGRRPSPTSGPDTWPLVLDAFGRGTARDLLSGRYSASHFDFFVPSGEIRWSGKPHDAIRVGRIEADSPLHHAGLREGDLIVGSNGTDFARSVRVVPWSVYDMFHGLGYADGDPSPPTVVELFAACFGDSTNLRVRRHGLTIDVEVGPLSLRGYDQQSDLGAELTVTYR